MDAVTHRDREALAIMRERANTVERIAWWLVRYATDPTFRQEEDQRAVEATDGNVSPLDAHLWSLMEATGRRELPWEEAPRAGA